MIAIKRSEQPDFMRTEGNKWELETARAIEHYETGGEGEFKYVHYNDPQLKGVLKMIFVKCAYCEGQYGHVFDGDVEHFRPKGRVNEKVLNHQGITGLPMNGKTYCYPVSIAISGEDMNFMAKISSPRQASLINSH
jgi:hypothetical protein